MAERGGGGGGRGRGGKFSKPKRGGARHFSQRTNDDGEVVNMWSAKGRQPSDDEDSSEEDSDSSEEETSSDDEGPSRPSVPGGPELTREQRKAEQKARKEAAIRKAKGTPQVGDMPSSDESDDEGADMPANPNHTSKARSQAAAPRVAAAADGAEPAAKGKGKEKEAAQLSRREREALQAQAAKERYQKLHAEGKTDEARADLARLKLIKEKREAEAERRKAEAEEKAAEAKARAENSGLSEREKKMREAALGKTVAGKKKK